ncbi:MAG: DUF1638 domain-containing protein [Treponema sp.]|nr:DUF1638 domain-containing protein [Treponema sp.]
MKRFKVIACEATAPQAEMAAKECGNEIDLRILDIGLHEVGQEKMPVELQKAIDEVNADRYDAILLAYGLCNNGICGLHAAIPIVAPRAHDCITLFMGSKEKYRQYFDTHPGSMFVSAGTMNPKANESLFSGIDKREKMRQEFLAKYDEEDVEYLMETLGNPLKNYHRITFINDGVGNIKGNRDIAQRIASDLDWDFEEFQGSADLFHRLLSGDWDEDSFLVIRPGDTIKPSYTETIIRSGARRCFAGEPE